MSWREQAACATETADWWDLIGGDGPNAEGTLTEANRAAIRICGMCPVARQCFEEGLGLGDRGVIRGGIALFKPSERHRCEKCGKGFLRVISAGKGPDRRRRNCEACHKPVGVHLSGYVDWARVDCSAVATPTITAVPADRPWTEGAA